MSRPDVNNHPCFNVHIKGKCGRVHLPVAPDCNIKCNYCNRKYDCVNESRPGITSSVLSPNQAVLYLEKVLDKAPHITVAGIAGPGDAFAKPTGTMETLRAVRQRFPELILCLATNGLNVEPYIDELADLDVSHVTMTINAVDPEIGSRIYSWVRFGKVIYRGVDAAQLLLERQLEAVAALKAKNIIVKVNSIVIPGVNDEHIPSVSKKMAEMGVDIQNCMTMYPNADTPFAHIPEPDEELMRKVRGKVGEIIPQMLHCQRCRADAVGLLDDDRSAEFRDTLSSCSRSLVLQSEGKPYVAVATMEGILVNQHLGEAERFQIWGPSPEGYSPMEFRRAPERGSGIDRWYQLAGILKDCRAVLVSGIGETPKQVLEEHEILPVEMSGFIKAGLEAIYVTGETGVLKGRKRMCSKAAGCSGTGEGCG